MIWGIVFAAALVYGVWVVASYIVGCFSVDENGRLDLRIGAKYNRGWRGGEHVTRYGKALD
jgi:hypothetical protein